jgi:transposase
MITVPAGLRVLIATKPVDFRRGADGLAALLRETLGEDPFSGTIYVFRSKRARWLGRNRIRMIFS